MPSEIEGRINYCFQQPQLLELALRHESYANEEGDPNLSNERLEFLGDAVLGLVVCDYLYHQFPHDSEGRLAQMKSQLVSTEQLATYARALDLGTSVKLGRGEQGQGRRRSSLLADAFEAIVGAIYLDGGYRSAESFVLQQAREVMSHADSLRTDPKSALQETTQKEYRHLPEYIVLSEEGPSHDKTFHVEVRLGQEALGEGIGRSKRDASQKAADQALLKLAEAEVAERLRAAFESPSAPHGEEPE